MELRYSIPLGEQYKIDVQEYAETPVADLPFSVRIANRFSRYKIITVSDLLKKSPEDLMQISGFGRKCLDEIDRIFTGIQNGTGVVSEHHATHYSGTVIRRYIDRILAGDFSFEEDLPNHERASVETIRKAYDCLGADLVVACSDNQSEIQSIIEMLGAFCYKAERANELQAIVDSLPNSRRKNPAMRYIYAFTQDEDKRKVLKAQYGNTESSIEQISINTLDSGTTFVLIKRFLKWCAFDLPKDIEESLQPIIMPPGKIKTVVEMRARKYTLDAVGKRLGVTRERIRQLEQKAIRIFAKTQGRLKIITKIAAEKSGDAIITTADIERYAGEYSVELLFLLRNVKSSVFTYDEQLDVFVIGDDSLHDRVYAFVETLPDVFSVKSVPEYLQSAKDECELPETMVEKAIAEAYRQTGDVFHRSRLSLASIYTSILKKYYPNGFRAYVPSEIRQFRELVYTEYGEVQLPTNDRALTARIAGICILCGRGMYKLKQKNYIPKKLAQRIYNYIDESEHSIFLTNTLFAVFEKDLRKAGVDNKYYLQGILHELYGDELFFSRDYVSKFGGETSIYASVVDFIKDSKYPVSKEQIEQAFPGISEIVINFSVSDPNILNYFGEYLHASRLEISPREERYLKQALHQVVQDGTAHHIKDVYALISAEKPEILTRNAARYPFCAFSILEYLFRDSYQFSRPYIAMQGEEIIRAGEKLHDYIYGQDEFTFDDIGAFCAENHYMIQSQLEYVNSCNDRYLIVDGEKAMTIDRIGVTKAMAEDIEAVAKVEVIDTMPIRQLTCWGNLPRINVPWTEWLLYSVLNKWATEVEVAPSSNQFRLSIPLISRPGEMDTTPFADAYKDPGQYGTLVEVKPDDLDDLDALLMDLLDDDLLEGEIWD